MDMVSVFVKRGHGFAVGCVKRFLRLTAASPLRVLKFDAPDGVRVVVAASPQFIASLRRLARFARKIV